MDEHQRDRIQAAREDAARAAGQLRDIILLDTPTETRIEQAIAHLEEALESAQAALKEAT